MPRGVSDRPAGFVFAAWTLVAGESAPPALGIHGNPVGQRLAQAGHGVVFEGLAQGFFHGASGFASGLPLQHYKQVLAQSVFALCPEGDRHLDTFRLYESLQMGCIPLVVDVDNQAQALLGDRWPLPPLACWGEALAFAVSTLQSPVALNALQDQTQRWWQQRCQLLSTALSTV